MTIRAARRQQRAWAAGFSLLEVMVAMAILALALVVLLRITTNNVRATVRARSVTVATFLARAKLAQMEDDILRDGFTDTDQEDSGDFGDEGHAQFRWKSLIERVELPTDAVEKAQEAATEATQEATTGESANPMMAMAGMMGGFMSTLIEPIRIGLQESVRRVTVTVFWDEVGRGEQSFDVTAFLTDPAKLDLAMPGAMPAGGGQGGAPGSGQGGRGGSTGTGGIGGSSGARPPSPRPPGIGGSGR